jgi:hypothetical protein
MDRPGRLAKENQMPAISFADSRGRLGAFHNAIQPDRKAAPGGRQFEGLLGVSNTPDGLTPGRHALLPNDIYHQLSIPANSAGGAMVGHRVIAGGIGTAIKRHPVAAGVVLTTAILATVAVVVRPASHDLVTATSWPDMPKPQPLIMSNSEASSSPATIIDICNRAIEKFPRTADAHENFPSMEELYSIESDAESILQLAQGMVRDNAVGSRELRRAAACSGGRLRRRNVEPLIADLQAEKSRLLEGVAGDSIDMPGRVLVAQRQVAGIDQRLGVLMRTSGHLYDATVALNTRLLKMAG